MKDNFFKIDRKIFDSCVFRSEIDFRLFFYLMGNAVFSKEGVKRTESLTIQRGQYQRSLDNLVDDLYFVENKKIKKYPKSSLRASIKRLEKFNMISCEKHELGTIFTLINYAKYQDKKGFEDDDVAPNHAQYPHNDGTVSAQYPHHNKNDKNDKNEKNDNNKDIVVTKVTPKRSTYDPNIYKTRKDNMELFAKDIYMTLEEYDELCNKHTKEKVDFMIEAFQDKLDTVHDYRKSKKYKDDSKVVNTFCKNGFGWNDHIKSKSIKNYKNTQQRNDDLLTYELEKEMSKLNGKSLRIENT